MRWLRLLPLLFSACAPAYAEDIPCGPRELIVEKLQEKWDEQLSSLALVEDGMKIMEIYSNEDTGSFTILLTDSDGQSCMILSGEEYAHIKTLKGEVL